MDHHYIPPLPSVRLSSKPPIALEESIGISYLTYRFVFLKTIHDEAVQYIQKTNPLGHL
jgi:hypothetical protein